MIDVQLDRTEQLSKIAVVRVSADTANTEEERKQVLKQVEHELREQLGWQEPRKGLSADCKLGGAMALAIAMGGREHPCDRCNHDRTECRGYPRRER